MYFSSRHPSGSSYLTQIYYSNDYGENWSSYDYPQYWLFRGLASNYNSSILIASAWGEYIYMRKKFSLLTYVRSSGLWNDGLFIQSEQINKFIGLQTTDSISITSAQFVQNQGNNLTTRIVNDTTNNNYHAFIVVGYENPWTKNGLY